MGEYKDRSDLIYEKLVKRLEEEGYDIFALEPHINSEIVDLIMDSQLENYAEFEQLVKDSIAIINS